MHLERHPELKETLVGQVLEKLEAFIAGRGQRRAAGKAGALSFFNTGMLPILKKIANGEGKPSDQKELQRLLATTEARVNKIMETLMRERNKLMTEPAGIDFAHRIDDIVAGSFGKVKIRQRIDEVIRTDIASPHLPALARQVCNEIEKFNRDVSNLGHDAADWGKRN